MMMAAYQPTPGIPHPSLSHGHPGMTTPNPGQHMVQPMMHAGAGAPHMAQMGIQPGAGAMANGMTAHHPNAMLQAQRAHNMQNPAMHQMTPQQQQRAQLMMQQAQIAAQMQGNPQMQQRMQLLQQQQHLQQQAQQAQMQASGVNMPNQQAMMQLQAQHGNVNLPPHLLQQQLQAQQQAQAQVQRQQMYEAQQQQRAQQQQHAQQQQQAQQVQQQQAQAHAQQQAQQQLSTPQQPPQPPTSQAQQQPQQPTPQQPQQQQAMQLQQQQQQQAALQQQQAQQAVQAQQQAAQAQQQQQLQQQHLAMQHSSSHQSNQGQAGPQNHPGQQNLQAQMRPQSRTANSSEQTTAGLPQTPQQPSQTPQPQAQQTPQQTQAAAANQHNMQMMRAKQAQLTAQRMATAQPGMVQQQQQNTGFTGAYILKMMMINDKICAFSAATGKDLAKWQEFVDANFSPEAFLTHGFEDPLNNKTRNFEVCRDSIARYFYTFFESGAQSLRLHTESSREARSAVGWQISSQNAILSVSYANGVKLEMHGSLRVTFSASTDLIDSWNLQTNHTDESLSRSQIEKVVSDWEPSLSLKSPVMTKGKLPKAQQKKMQEQQDRLTIDHFPKTCRGTLGVSARVQNFLEVGETMSIMADLMNFSQENNMRAEKALDGYVSSMDSMTNGAGGGNPQAHMQANGVAPGVRTPAMQNRPMPQNGMQGAFASPSMPNLNLPVQPNGSPHPGNLNLGAGMMGNVHTPSPHISNMAAPPMIPQHSAQGTNSSTASANTSPNVNPTSNKRRRSTVKMEGDEPGAEGGGNAKVKPSPRMTKKQRP